MYLINTRYLWYIELVTVYKSFAHPEMRQRCSLIKVVWKKTKKPNHLNFFSEYVFYNQVSTELSTQQMGNKHFYE